jgi:hypothetical protein
MTKFRASFTDGLLTDLLAALYAKGCEWRNPATGRITYLSDDGDEIEAASEREVIDAVMKGCTAQLWNSAGAGLLIQMIDDRPDLSFGGLTPGGLKAILGIPGLKVYHISTV